MCEGHERKAKREGTGQVNEGTCMRERSREHERKGEEESVKGREQGGAERKKRRERKNEQRILCWGQYFEFLFLTGFKPDYVGLPGIQKHEKKVLFLC